MPQQLTKALAIHSTMFQFSNLDDKVPGSIMQMVKKAMTDRTEWEGKFLTECA